jgi:ABC-type multidrug transport system ATPase subunit
MSIIGGGPTLRIQGLSKAYGRRPVLDGVDLTVPNGTITAVTGANGCGKSTLLRCIAGLAGHTGTITYDEEPVTARRGHIGYLPQTVGLPQWATVAEVIAFFARLRGADPTDLGFPDDFIPEPDRHVAVLSGGQRQRVALAVSLLGSPSLLLLDEPSTNLDDTSRSTLWEALAGVAAAGRTVLIATPIDADLDQLERTVVEIVDGRLVPAGVQAGRECRENGKTPSMQPSEARR